MKTLVIGGMHGNEPLGIEVVRALRARPLPDTDVVIANPRAVRANARFVEQDINRVFPGRAGGNYEQRRAIGLLRKSQKYELVLDFHNTQADQPSCGFVGLTYNSKLLGVAAALGINRVIEASYDCINKYASNCLSVEICMRDSDAEQWYRRLERLDRPAANLPVLYRYLRRVTWGESKQLQATAWKPFEEIPDTDKKVLGIVGSACPIFVGSRLTEYFATLIERVDEASDTIISKEIK